MKVLLLLILPFSCLAQTIEQDILRFGKALQYASEIEVEDEAGKHATIVYDFSIDVEQGICTIDIITESIFKDGEKYLTFDHVLFPLNKVTFSSLGGNGFATHGIEIKAKTENIMITSRSTLFDTGSSVKNASLIVIPTKGTPNVGSKAKAISLVNEFDKLKQRCIAEGKQVQPLPPRRK